MSEFAGDEEILKEIMESFVTNLPEMIAAIATAIANNDCKALEFSAHTVKGSASNFYVQAVVDSAFVLENQGRAGVMTNALENYKVLEKLTHELTTELWSFLKKAG